MNLKGFIVVFVIGVFGGLAPPGYSLEVINLSENNTSYDYASEINDLGLVVWSGEDVVGGDHDIYLYDPATLPGMEYSSGSLR